jgi:hypothetical protein
MVEVRWCYKLSDGAGQPMHTQCAGTAAAILNSWLQAGLLPHFLSTFLLDTTYRSGGIAPSTATPSTKPSHSPRQLHSASSVADVHLLLLVVKVHGSAQTPDPGKGGAFSPAPITHQTLHLLALLVYFERTEYCATATPCTNSPDAASPRPLLVPLAPLHINPAGQAPAGQPVHPSEH